MKVPAPPNQKRAISVCSAVRVALSRAPRLLTSSKAAVYWSLVRSGCFGGRNPVGWRGSGFGRRGRFGRGVANVDLLDQRLERLVDQLLRRAFDEPLPWLAPVTKAAVTDGHYDYVYGFEADVTQVRDQSVRLASYGDTNTLLVRVER